jgi:hypothetical protein
MQAARSRARLAFGLSTQPRLEFRDGQLARDGARSSKHAGRLGRAGRAAQQSRRAQRREVRERGERLVGAGLLSRERQEAVRRALLADARGRQAGVASHHAGRPVIELGQQRVDAGDGRLRKRASATRIELGHLDLQHVRERTQQGNAARALDRGQALHERRRRRVAAGALQHGLRGDLGLLRRASHVDREPTHATPRIGTGQSVERPVHVATRGQRHGEAVLRLVGQPHRHARIVRVRSNDLGARGQHRVRRLALARPGGLGLHASLQVLHRRERRVGRGSVLRQRTRRDAQRADDHRPPPHRGLAKLTRE